MEVLSGLDGDLDAIWGDLAPASSMETTERAKAFLADNAAIWGIQDVGRDLVLDSEATTLGAEGEWSHVVLNQVVCGMPLHGHRLVVHLASDGAVRGANGQFDPIAAGGTLDPNPAISSEAATQRALKHAHVIPCLLQQPRLEAYRGTADVRLAWVVQVVSASPAFAREYLIDAREGGVLSWRCTLAGLGLGEKPARADGTTPRGHVRKMVICDDMLGTGLLSEEVHMEAPWNTAHNLKWWPSEKIGDIRTYDGSGWNMTTFRGLGPVLEDTGDIIDILKNPESPWLAAAQIAWRHKKAADGDPDILAPLVRSKSYTPEFVPGVGTVRLYHFNDEKQKAAVDAHTNIKTVMSYFYRVHGRMSWNASAGVVNIGVYANAGNLDGGAAAAPGVILCQDADAAHGQGYPWTCLDVMAHEFTHLVVAKELDLSTDDPINGAINEHICDAFGKFVERAHAEEEAGNTWSWRFATGLYADPNRQCFRDLNSQDYPSIGSPDRSDKYRNLATLNKMLYLWINGGTGRDGRKKVTGLRKSLSRWMWTPAQTEERAFELVRAAYYQILVGKMLTGRSTMNDLWSALHQAINSLAPINAIPKEFEVERLSLLTQLNSAFDAVR